MSKNLGMAGRAAIGSAAVVALLIASPLPSLAGRGAADAPLVVTTLGDPVVAGGSCSLRDAVRAANLDAPVGACPAGHGADTIRLGAGRYVLSIAGRAEDASLTGDLDVTSELRIQGAGRKRTTIDAAGLDRALDVHGGSRLTVSSLTVTGGELGFVDVPPWTGGGIANEGTLVLRDVLVTGNMAGGAGGGIANEGTLRMTDSAVTENQAGPDAGGGGIYTSGTAILRRVTVARNLCASSGARDEGAAGIAATGYLFLDGGVVAGNHGSGEWTPGGISVKDGLIVRTTIKANQGGSYGTGGVVMTHSRMVASTVSGNAGGGDGGAGGILAIHSTVIDSTISGNQAGGKYGSGGPWANAGGIYAISSRIVGSTIAANVSVGIPGSPVSPSGGLHAESGTHVLGSIIAGNHGAAGSGQDCDGTVISDGFVLLGNATGCVLHAAHGDVVGQDPHLGPLADNGGPTRTRALRAGSPALDAWPVVRAGTPTGCPALDQRGVSRPQLGGSGDRRACDIGSVEMVLRH